MVHACTQMIFYSSPFRVGQERRGKTGKMEGSHIRPREDQQEAVATKPDFFPNLSHEVFALEQAQNPYSSTVSEC